MSDSAKQFKTGSNEAYTLNLAKTYNKTYLVLTEGKSNTPSSNSISSTISHSSTRQENNHMFISENSSVNSSSVFINSNNFSGELVKDKVLSWFFSLPLESRIKISTVEKDRIMLMLHQMHFRYKGDTKVVFQLKSFSEGDDKDNQNTNSKYVYKVNSSSQHCNYSSGNFNSDDDMSNFNILNVLNWKSNRNECGDSMIEKIWLNDVRVYSINSDFDAMTLCPRVLKDKALFDYYFKYVGSQKCFYSLIKPCNKNKTFEYDFPEWFDKKAYHSVGQFVAAYIEQSILIKYVLNYNKKEKLTFSLVNEKTMADFFTKRKEVIGCLNKHYDGENKHLLFQQISAKRIYNDVAWDNSIKQTIKNMNKHIDAGYYSFVSRKMTAGKTPSFSGLNDVETESKIISKYMKDYVVSFVDETLYHDLDSLWKENYYISKKMFEYLHCLYTDKNYEELVNDMIEDEATRKNSKKNKKGKNEKNEKTPTKKRNSNKGNCELEILVDSQEFEYYKPYLLEAKNQASPHNLLLPNIKKLESEKAKLNSNSITTNKENLKTNDITKGYLYDSYQNGKIKMITDFVKTQIIEDIMTQVITQAEDNLNNDKSVNLLCKEILCDLERINSKSKNIANILKKENEGFVEKKNFTETDENINIINKIIKNITGEEEQTTKEPNSKEEKSTTNIFEEKESLISPQAIDDIANKDIETQEEKSEPQNETKPEFKTEEQTSNEINIEEKEEKSNIQIKDTKKKKKEPIFFLYDTSRKKKNQPKEKKEVKDINSTLLATCTNNKKPSNESEKPKESPQPTIVTKPETKEKSTSTYSNYSSTPSNKKSRRNFDKQSKKEIIQSIAIRESRSNYKGVDNMPRSQKYAMSRWNNYPQNNYYFFNQVTNVTPNYQMMGSNRNVKPNDSLSNINLDNYSKELLPFFVFKLHNDIVSYHKNVTSSLENIREVKVFVIQFLEKLIKQNVEGDFNIDIYGSFASDLSIESSDIDIKIRLNSLPDSFDLENTLVRIVKNFNSLNVFDSVIPIVTASVPIIKIVVDPIKIADDDNLLRIEEFRHSEYFNNYKFDIEELLKIKIDLTFLGVGCEQGNISINNTMSSVDYAKNKLILHPEIKPLLHVLKRLLQIKKMNSCFNGGLSSFCLFLLILAFIQYKAISQTGVTQNNLGRMLLDFLEFYGSNFEFHGWKIDVNLHNPFFMTGDIYENSPTILDPLSGLNASRSSFNIDEVKKILANAYNYLHMIKLKYDKIDNQAAASNIIYDLLTRK